MTCASSPPWTGVSGYPWSARRAYARWPICAAECWPSTSRDRASPSRSTACWPRRGCAATSTTGSNPPAPPRAAGRRCWPPPPTPTAPGERRERYAATMLGAGHDLAAVRAGCHRIARVTELIRPYLGTVVAGFGPWLDAHGDVAAGFLAAWRAAAADVVEPGRRAGTLRVIEDHLGLHGADADEFYRVLVSPDEGLAADGAVDAAALAAIARLRAEYGGPDAAAPELTDLAATGIVDDRFRRR